MGQAAWRTAADNRMKPTTEIIRRAQHPKTGDRFHKPGHGTIRVLKAGHKFVQCGTWRKRAIVFTEPIESYRRLAARTIDNGAHFIPA